MSLMSEGLPISQYPPSASSDRDADTDGYTTVNDDAGVDESYGRSFDWVVSYQGCGDKPDGLEGEPVMTAPQHTAPVWDNIWDESEGYDPNRTLLEVVETPDHFDHDRPQALFLKNLPLTCDMRSFLVGGSGSAGRVSLGRFNFSTDVGLSEVSGVWLRFCDLLWLGFWWVCCVLPAKFS